MAEAAIAIKSETENSSEAWAQALNLPCRLSVDMPMPQFTVADMLRLQKNSVVKSQWRVGTDVPVRVNGRLIAHAEFEVVGNHLALRLTDLI